MEFLNDTSYALETTLNENIMGALIMRNVCNCMKDILNKNNIGILTNDWTKYWTITGLGTNTILVYPPHPKYDEGSKLFLVVVNEDDKVLMDASYDWSNFWDIQEQFEFLRMIKDYLNVK